MVEGQASHNLGLREPGWKEELTPELGRSSGSAGCPGGSVEADSSRPHCLGDVLLFYLELPQSALCQLLSMKASPGQTDVGTVPLWPVTLEGAFAGLGQVLCVSNSYRH